MMYDTLLLDTDAWDLVLDINGNIAMAAPPYSLAQDVASAVRTFAGEVYYDTTQGVPYFADVLGTLPPASLLTQLIADRALDVPGVTSAECVLIEFNDRGVTGQLQFTDESGETTIVNF